MEPAQYCGRLAARRLAPRGLTAAAERHTQAGLEATLAGHDYAGDHWLPSFAVYLLTSSGPGRPET